MPDFVFWAVTLYLVMRLLASRDPRWWLAIGGCAGIASEAKWNIAFLAAALAAGFCGHRRPAACCAAATCWLGCVIAAALAAPDVIWQAAHGWPSIDVFRALQGQAGHNRATYWLAQVLFTGLVLAPVWVAGAIWSVRSEAARRFRPVGHRLRDRGRAAVRARRQGVLPGRGLHVPARGRLRAASSAGWPRASRGRRGSARRPCWRGDARGRGGGRADRAAGAARPGAGHGPAAEDQLRPGRNHRLAAAGGPDGPRVPRAAARPAGQPPRSWPATTARPGPSTGTGPATACRRRSAAPTTSGTGARPRPATGRPSP